MSLFGKVEAEIEIKAFAYKFYEVNSKRVAEAPKFCPNFIRSVDFFFDRQLVHIFNNLGNYPNILHQKQFETQ